MHTIFKSYNCCGIVLLLLLGMGCTKKSDCITIAEKREFNGNFYFYWEDQNAFTTTNNNPDNSLTGVPDRYASGQVSAEDFKAYAVGDEYCNTD